MKKAAAIAMLLVLSSISGCLGPRLDRGQELISHPDFEDVVNVSPSFVESALGIIVDLEQQIESQR